jgi:outer membrane protein
MSPFERYQGRSVWPKAVLLAAALACVAASAQAMDFDGLSEVTADTGGPTQPGHRPRQFLFGFLGASVFNTGRYLGSNDRVTVPFPLVYFNYNDRVYWSIASVGGWLWRADDRSFKAGLIAKARGGVQGDKTGYDGVQDRKASADAGLNLLWRTAPVNVGLSVLTDVGGRSDGQSASLRLSKRLKLTGNWSLTPSLGAEWLDRKVVDYYYGVHPEDSSGGAPLYQGRSAVNLHAILSTGYRLAPHWALFGGVAYSRLGNGIADSPLVQRRTNTLVFAGIGWSFLDAN